MLDILYGLLGLIFVVWMFRRMLQEAKTGIGTWIPLGAGALVEINRNQDPRMFRVLVNMKLILLVCVTVWSLNAIYTGVKVLEKSPSNSALAEAKVI